MRLWTAGIVALCLGGLILAQDDKTEGKSRADRLQAVKGATNKAMEEYRKTLGEAKTAEERREASGNFQRTMMEVRQKQAADALALAKENPKDDVGFDAILLAIQSSPPNAAPRGEAIALLKEHHLANPKIESVIGNMARSGRGYDKGLLKEIVEKSPAKSVKAIASMTLAQATLEEAEARGITEEQIKTKVAEGEKLLNDIAKEYGDVEVKAGKVADLVKRDLAAIKLTKVTPEIEGEDIDGKKFKISDYRGKVVMLDFWGHW